eukprot:scaffold121100_cov21-Tisochrysis_lutea.AAC.1
MRPRHTHIPVKEMKSGLKPPPSSAAKNIGIRSEDASVAMSMTVSPKIRAPSLTYSSCHLQRAKGSKGWPFDEGNAE